VQRDLGALSRVGATYADVADGRASNRVADADAARVLATEIVAPGDAVLVKASRSARLEELVEEIVP
jgi:UDP-N-acetylmuramyl pentapeptide synthase